LPSLDFCTRKNLLVTTINDFAIPQAREKARIEDTSISPFKQVFGFAEKL